MKYNAVLRGLQTEVPFLQRKLIRLCCDGSDPFVKKYLERGETSQAEFERVKECANCYTTTIFAINSLIVKTSKLTYAQPVYRGVENLVLPEQFWQKNNFGVKGGVESAFMSTTRDKDVAKQYALEQQSKGGAGFLFEMQQGMVDRGSDLSWLSQYPHEKEILFAPLTGIEVQSTRIEDSVVVVEVRLSINLKTETIEQVVSKMQSSHMTLINTIKDNFVHAGVPTNMLTGLYDLLHKAHVRGFEHFNSSELYLNATNEAIETINTCFDQLTRKEAWKRESGQLDDKLMHLAELCARSDRHSEAAKVLMIRFELCASCPQKNGRMLGELTESGANAFNVAKSQYGSNVKELQPEQMAAFKALIDLLDSRDDLDSRKALQQPWPLTILELTKLANDPTGVRHVAAAGIELKVPIVVLRHRMFGEDATAQAYKGTELTLAASAGNVSALEKALQSHHAMKLASKHEHPLIPTEPQRQWSAVCDICGETSSFMRCAKEGVCSACRQHGMALRARASAGQRGTLAWR